MLDALGEANAAALFGLLGGVVLGLAARIGRFCTLGAIEDALYSSDSRRLRMWGLAIGVAIVGSQISEMFGYLETDQSLYLRTAWNPLASIIGGLVFGYGMALSGNCGYGALARMGGGDLRAFVVVLIMGLSAYVVMSGPLAQARVWLFPVTSSEGTPQGFTHLFGTLGLPPTVIGGLIGCAIVALALAHRDMARSGSHVLWGIAVGLAVVSGWLGTQWIARTGFAAEPIVTHSFAVPIGETVLYAMTASGSSMSFGIGSVVGVVVGAAIGAWSRGQFQWDACEDPRELRRQIFGATLMGSGAVLALGCSVGQGISAFSVLSFSAPVTFAAIFIGAALGLRQLIEGFARI